MTRDGKNNDQGKHERPEKGENGGSGRSSADPSA